MQQISPQAGELGELTADFGSASYPVLMPKHPKPQINAAGRNRARTAEAVQDRNRIACREARETPEIQSPWFHELMKAGAAHVTSIDP
jgi:hypothetical protein